MARAKFIQVGVTSVRDPATGNMIQATPLYVKVKDGAEVINENLVEAVGSVFAHQMRDYIKSCQEAGVEI